MQPSGNGRLPAKRGQDLRSLLELLAEGHTDESAGRKLAVSTRSVQRTMTVLTQRLGAGSRFQAGVEATRKGWVR